MSLQEKLHEWYIYWSNSSYSTTLSWRQAEFSKLVSADKNGESYY